MKDYFLKVGEKLKYSGELFDNRYIQTTSDTQVSKTGKFSLNTTGMFAGEYY